MSGWGMGWFGGGAAKKKDAPKNAILQMRGTLEMLNKRERHLQNQIDEQGGLARKFANTNKNQAITALRRKKQLETQLSQTSAQMMTLEREISSIETANINKETLDAMKNAASAMKTIHGNLTIDKVDQTMEELRDQHAITEEINEAMTSGANAEMGDEDELNAELEELQQETLDERMLKGGNVPVGDEIERRLPSVAGTEPKRPAALQQEDEDEEAELKKLQAEMAM